MSEKEHKERHILLHKHFDELLADFIRITGKAPLTLLIKDLVNWSHKQTLKPENPQ